MDQNVPRPARQAGPSPNGRWAWCSAEARTSAPVVTQESRNHASARTSTITTTATIRPRLSWRNCETCCDDEPAKGELVPPDVVPFEPLKLGTLPEKPPPEPTSAPPTIAS